MEPLLDTNGFHVCLCQVMVRTDAFQKMGAATPWPRRLKAAAPLLVLGSWLSLADGTNAPLLAQEVQPLVSSPSSTQAVYLDYQALPSRVKGWRLDITPRTTQFKNEPDLAGRSVCRGTIQAAFQGVQKPGEHFGSSINAPFLWDYTEGKLYLDLSRNGDLAGALVFSTPEKAGYDSKPSRYYYQPFTNINLTFRSSADSHPRLVDIHLYGHSGQKQPGGNLEWRCFWQGKVFLQGRDWQIGLVEDANHVTTPLEGYFLLRPWAERDRPLSLENGSLDCLKCPTNLFFQTRAYRLTFDYLKGDVSRYRLDLAEIAPEMGEVAVQGQYMDRLIFREHQSQPPFTVVVDSPGPVTKIPVGIYNNYDVYLKREGAEAFRSYRGRYPVKLTISATNRAVINVGGPLTNSVVVVSRRRTILLDYQLKGADGSYQMMGNNRTNPPRFTISQANKQLTTGTFEFG